MTPLSVFQTYQLLSVAAADEMIAIIQTYPAPLICLATGDTPILTYQLFCERVTREKINLSHCTFIGLDEWLGIPQETPGTCFHFLHQHIFLPLQIPQSQIHLFPSDEGAAQQAAEEMDRFIESKGGISLAVVGIGMNGHIGFNEPGTSLNTTCHIILLDETTCTIGQKYFQTMQPIAKGITVGLKHILSAKKVLLLAAGLAKAAIIAKTLQGNITENIPASLLRQSANTLFLMDAAAASKLTPL